MNPSLPFLSGMVFAAILAAAVQLVTPPPAEAAPAMASAPQCVVAENATQERPDIAAIIAALPANLKPERQDEIGALIGGLK